MNAPLPFRCPCCGETADALYALDDDVGICGECLDAAMASDDCVVDVDDAFNLGLSEVRR